MVSHNSFSNIRNTQKYELLQLTMQGYGRKRFGRSRIFVLETYANDLGRALVDYS